MTPKKEIPDNWRELHRCRRFTTDKKGQCVFCRMNDDLAPHGLEAIPFDIPGVYTPKDEPHVITRKVSTRQMDTIPLDIAKRPKVGRG